MPRPGLAFVRGRALDRRGDTLAACGHELRCYVQPPAETYTIVGNTVVAAPNPAYRPAVFACRECGAELSIA